MGKPFGCKNAFMIKIALVLCSSLALAAGCASVIESTPNHVIVRKGAVMSGKPFDVANAECQKFGKRAVYTGHPHEGYVYDCR
jgi:surface antigen